LSPELIATLKFSPRGVFMSAPYSVADRIELLRSRAQRYKGLGEVLQDRRRASEISGYADELEAEVIRLEKWERVNGSLGIDRTAFAP
jgi:hypothetical protein